MTAKDFLTKIANWLSKLISPATKGRTLPTLPPPPALIETIKNNAPIEPNDPRWETIYNKAAWEKEWNIGTTCADYLGYVLQKAGLDPACLEPKGRFRTGARLFQCAERKHAILRSPKLSDLQKGDIFEVREPGNPSNWHVGFIWEINGDNIITVDGGQGTIGAQRVDYVRRRWTEKDGRGFFGKRRIVYIIRPGILF